MVPHFAQTQTPTFERRVGRTKRTRNDTYLAQVWMRPNGLEDTLELCLVEGGAGRRERRAAAAAAESLLDILFDLLLVRRCGDDTNRANQRNCKQTAEQLAHVCRRLDS